MPPRRPSALPQNPRKAIAHLRGVDPRLGRVIDAVGPVRLPRRDANLHMLCASIIGQSISTKAAASITRRFNEAVGGAENLTPARVLKKSVEDLRGLGLNRVKAGALRGVAEVWRENRWTPEKVALLEDDALVEALTAVRGIGPWTVKMFLIFGLRRPDVMPWEDLGMCEGLKRIYALDERPKKRAEIEALTDPWRPWRSVGVLYAWESLLLSRDERLDSDGNWWTET